MLFNKEPLVLEAGQCSGVGWSGNPVQDTKQMLHRREGGHLLKRNTGNSWREAVVGELGETKFGF